MKKIIKKIIITVVAIIIFFAIGLAIYAYYDHESKPRRLPRIDAAIERRYFNLE